MLLLVWMALPRSVPTPTPGGDATPAPASTAPTPPSAPGAAAPATERLHILLRPLQRSGLVHETPPVPFARIWPSDPSDWDLDALDQSDTASALRDLARPGASVRGAHGRRVLERARAEGLDPSSPGATPESALVALHLAWVRSEQDYGEQVEALVQTVHPGLTWSELGPRQIAALAQSEHWPTQDTAGLQALAEEVQATWPDHPVADHATLAWFRAQMPKGPRVPWDLDTATEALTALPEGPLQTAAALELTQATGTMGLSVEALDRVAAVDLADPDAAVAVASWGADRALALGDWERTRAWNQRLARALDAACPPSESPHPRCVRGTTLTRDLHGRLVALDHEAPTDWREALRSAAWRCFLDGRGHEGISTTTATWDGTWHFDSWHPPTGVTRCLEDAGPPQPTGPVRVDLVVEADTPRE